MSNNVIHYLFLVILCVPSLFLIEIEGVGYFFGYYLVGIVLIALTALYRTRWPSQLVIAGVVMIVNSAIHAGSTRLGVLFFDLFFLILFAVFSRYSYSQYYFTRLVRSLFWVYCGTLVFCGLMDIIGLNLILPSFLYTIDRETGGFRYHAFATESSYAALLLLIFYRYLFRESDGKLPLRYLFFVSLSIFIAKSMYGMLSLCVILFLHLSYSRKSYKIPLAMFFSMIMVYGVSVSEFFINRILMLVNSESLIQTGSAGIRLLPIVFFIEQLYERSFLFLLFGNGAGSMGPLFYEKIGHFYTSSEQLATHMIGFVYNYGLIPIILVSNFTVSKVRIHQAFFIVMFLLVATNSGFGTYLFLIFIIVERASRDFLNSVENKAVSS